MSNQPRRTRGGAGDAGSHWDPAHFTWDPYEARAEPRSGSGSAGEPQGGGSNEAEGVPGGSGGGGGEGADPALAGMPPPPPGMEDVPSLDPSYDLTGVQKRSVPLVLGCGKKMDDVESPEGDYYQRYRVCQAHLTLSVLLKEAVPQRFCQQCGRFHHLTAFDGNRRSCRQRLNAHNDRRRKRVGGESMSGGDGRSVYRGRGRPRRGGGRRGRGRRPRGESSEDAEDSEEQEEAGSGDSASWARSGRRAGEAAESAGGELDELGRTRYHLRPRSARMAQSEAPAPQLHAPQLPPDARRLLPPEILNVMELLDSMRGCRDAGGAGTDLEAAALQGQAAAHAAADAAFAAGMRRHQSDPVNVPQRLGELSGALIASLSSPNPHRAIAAAAAAEQQGLAQGTLPPDYPLERTASGAAYSRELPGERELVRESAGAQALSWLQGQGPAGKATAAAFASTARPKPDHGGGSGGADAGMWAPSRMAGRPPSSLLDTASRVRQAQAAPIAFSSTIHAVMTAGDTECGGAQAQAAAFQQLMAAQARLQAPSLREAGAPGEQAPVRELRPEGLTQQAYQAAMAGVLPASALEAMLRQASAEARPLLLPRAHGTHEAHIPLAYTSMWPKPL